VGQRWGIVGVAWGVLLALTVNFLFMAQLSLSESTMPWSDFWRAHVPAILITLASSPLVWIGATALRHWGAPPVVTAGAGLLIMVGCTLLLMFLAPARFLGADGQWMVGTMRSFVQKVKRPASRSQS
jgi:PST family polysaccharide transporter